MKRVSLQTTRLASASLPARAVAGSVISGWVISGWAFSGWVIIAAGVIAGCGNASSDGGSELGPGAAGTPGGPVDEAPGSEETPAETPPDAPGAGSEPSAETNDGELPLEPGNAGAGGAPGSDTGEPVTPDAGVGGADNTPEPLQKFVGNITTFNSVDTDGFVYSEYWDQITPENAGKWGSVQRTADAARNWAALDAIYDYAQQNGIIFKQHAFVWGSQQPSGDIDQAEVQSWIQEFCARYPDTRLIDVVNEPPPHTEPSYSEAIGGGTNGNWQWIANAFTWARESCPNAVLILNDYNNIEFGNQNQHFIDITRTILAQGAPVDAVGAQAHGLSGGVSTATMQSLITRLHDETGLPVYVTEYDIDLADDSAQLGKFQEHLPFFLETEWIHGVTVWGWILGKTWVNNSGLIRNGTPRPAMTWLMNELGRPVPQ